MTFDHRPINTITATTAAELAELVWLDLLVRLSRAPVVSIASIRARAGSELRHCRRVLIG